MQQMTIADAIATHEVDVLEHLDREVTIPILDGLQFQGDVAVVPTPGKPATTPVPKKGIPVVRGEAGGNTHSLHADGPVFFDGREATAQNLLLGVLTVPEGSTAYLAHPEHGYSGIAPGQYNLTRQREQADELRVVTD